MLSFSYTLKLRPPGSCFLYIFVILYIYMSRAIGTQYVVSWASGRGGAGAVRPWRLLLMHPKSSGGRLLLLLCMLRASLNNISRNTLRKSLELKESREWVLLSIFFTFHFTVHRFRNKDFLFVQVITEKFNFENCQQISRLACINRNTSKKIGSVELKNQDLALMAFLRLNKTYLKVCFQ